MTTESILATRTAPPAAPPGDGIIYDGQAGQLAGLGLKVAALTLLTLGIYRFWGKTEIRRYFLSRLRLATDRFEYTGTGGELFLGFLIVLAVLIPYGILSQTLTVLSVAWSPVAQAVVGIVEAVFILFLFGYALYRARRYRLSRTLLRGIRFGQAGSAARYGMMFLGYMLLTGITLGIAKPVGDVALYRFQTRNTLFGNQTFDFDGNPGEMMGRWIVCLLLIPFTLGLSLMWYAAYKMRYLTAGTGFENIRFAMPVTLRDLMGIYLPYILVLFFLMALLGGILMAVLGVSIFAMMDAGGATPEISAAVKFFTVAGIVLISGILAPMFHLVLVTHRYIGLVVERLEIQGAANFESIIQRAAQKAGAAEGLADAIDVGVDVEIGF